MKYKTGQKVWVVYKRTPVPYIIDSFSSYNGKERYAAHCPNNPTLRIYLYATDTDVFESEYDAVKEAYAQWETEYNRFLRSANKVRDTKLAEYAARIKELEDTNESGTVQNTEA